MVKDQKLIAITFEQHGYFTASQAAEAGYSRKNHSYHLKTGEWSREGRGIFRHNKVPVTEFSQYWFYYLWSRNNQDEPQGIYSHETALNLYELSDINPSKIYMTLPKKFRTTKTIPKILKIHKENVHPNEIKTIEGLKITTVMKTLIDIVSKGTLSEEFIEQAVKEALHRGLIRKSILRKEPSVLRYAI